MDKVSGSVKAEGYAHDINDGVFDATGKELEPSGIVTPAAKDVSGIGSLSGDVAISNSDLDITVRAEDCYGIESKDTKGGASSVKINNSTLDISAPKAAIVSWSTGEGSTIELTDTTITEGGEVVNIAADGKTGQTIGTGDVTSLDDPKLSKDVKTEAADPSALTKEKRSKPNMNAPAATGSVAAAATTAPAAVASAVADAAQTPKTADNTTAPFAAACAFASAALMAMAVRMRKATLGKHVK